MSNYVPMIWAFVVAVREDFIGAVGFFYGKHFGAELTMEISEFPPGTHRPRWKC